MKGNGNDGNGPYKGFFNPINEFGFALFYQILMFLGFLQHYAVNVANNFGLIAAVPPHGEVTEGDNEDISLKGVIGNTEEDDDASNHDEDAEHTEEDDAHVDGFVGRARANTEHFVGGDCEHTEEDDSEHDEDAEHTEEDDAHVDEFVGRARANTENTEEGGAHVGAVVEAVTVTQAVLLLGNGDNTPPLFSGDDATQSNSL